MNEYVLAETSGDDGKNKNRPLDWGSDFFGKGLKQFLGIVSGQQPYRQQYGIWYNNPLTRPKRGISQLGMFNYAKVTQLQTRHTQLYGGFLN